MTQEPKPPTPQALVRLEKAEKLAREGKEAWAEYEAARRAADVKISRLKALRLAKEEASAKEAAPAPLAPARKARQKRASKTAAEV